MLWPSGWSLVTQIVLAQLIISFASYWVHRAFHEVDRLWWFHAIHHDTEQVHVLKSGRFHFADELYSALLTPLPILLARHLGWGRRRWLLGLLIAFGAAGSLTSL